MMARGLALLAAAAVLLAAGQVSAKTRPPPAPADDMSMGNPRAKVTVVEYASASCPHCARFNNNVFPAFKAKYVKTGKVRYVLREFLTDPVQVAAAGFLLARCAGPGKYFSVLDDFFHGQEEMYRTGDARALIDSVGAKAGLSGAQVEACLSDQAAADALNARVQRNQTLDNVESTPTFVINGRKLPESDHEVNLADLDAAIGPLLIKTRRR
jgi:protein-disulfide isomerase